MPEQLDMPVVSPEDQRLIDLVDSVLTDPNLHTETRMRLHEQIFALLGETAPYGHPAHPPVAEQAPPSDPKLAELVRSVLVDPALHTDVRMRLHNEIPALIKAHRK